MSACVYPLYVVCLQMYIFDVVKPQWELAWWCQNVPGKPYGDKIKSIRGIYPGTTKYVKLRCKPKKYVGLHRL